MNEIIDQRFVGWAKPTRRRRTMRLAVVVQETCQRQFITPLLLLRDEAIGRLVIVDGYHRMCAVVLMDANVLISGKIV